MNSKGKISRRKFLAGTIGIASLAGLGVFGKSFVKFFSSKDTSGKLHSSLEPAGYKKASIPSRMLGATGYEVKVLSLGGQGALEIKDNTDEAVGVIRRALELGVNYFDTAPLYGQSELYYGEALGQSRKDIFLASKTHKRTYDAAMKLLEKSLQRLKTDYLDLWQIHNVEDKYDVEDIFAKNGVWKAMVKAKEEKITRFIGITGHYDPAVLKDAIQRVDFDTVLMALNAADKHFKSFIQNLLPTAVEKNMGIIGMKVLARGRIFEPSGITKAEDAIGYVLSHPVSTVIVGCDSIQQLEENVRIASGFKPLDEKAIKGMEDLTASYYREASFFKIEH